MTNPPNDPIQHTALWGDDGLHLDPRPLRLDVRPAHGPDGQSGVVLHWDGSRDMLLLPVDDAMWLVDVIIESLQHAAHCTCADDD